MTAAGPSGPARRGVLKGAAALVGAALSGARPLQAWTTPRFLNDPFQLGVASGEPLADGFVLWTRLAPDPFDAQALPPVPIAVTWQVGHDETMRRVVRQGRVLARPEFAHAVHVEVRGLEPDRPYWYRFEAGGAQSPGGRARTVPLAGTPMARLRFAFTSCQHYEQGFFGAYRHMIADQPDLIVHLGDYIYETSWGNPVRRHAGPEPRTLDEYRLRHALYKTDPDLQAAHAACPWLATWDDHEVDNDYAADRSQDFDDPAAFARRRRAAYQAYYEHMPLRRSAMPTADGMRVYQRYIFGDLAELDLLDIRQYRSDQACAAPGAGGGRLLKIEDCPELADPARTMLGEAQERWLLRGLGGSGAKWTVIAQQTLFASLAQRADGAPAVWSEGWSGYRPARERILAALGERPVSNPVFIGGDMHSFWATDIRGPTDGAAPSARSSAGSSAPPLATEFVTTSLAAAGPPDAVFRAMLPDNPQVRFFDARYRGYGLCTLTPEAWRTEFRAIDDMRRPEPAVRTLAAFIVSAGRPGAESA
jgi:alkaline phosphatase D